jgi:hypothetical protein
MVIIKCAMVAENFHTHNNLYLRGGPNRDSRQTPLIDQSVTTDKTKPRAWHDLI